MLSVRMNSSQDFVLEESFDRDRLDDDLTLQWIVETSYYLLTHARAITIKVNTAQRLAYVKTRLKQRAAADDRPETCLIFGMLKLTQSREVVEVWD